MSSGRTWRTATSAAWLALCALMMAGCATWQGPRIDPTGERMFVWQQPPAAVPAYPDYGAAPPFAAQAAPIVEPTVVGPPIVGAPVVGAPVPFAGNVQAPPVYSQPVVGPVQNRGLLGNLMPTVGAPVATVQGPPIVTSGPVATQVGPTTVNMIGVDQLRVSPERVLAPVGSEVVLKAGVCGSSGRMMANQRVEWMLERDGVGEFIALNSGNSGGLLDWNWNRSGKVDNWYAIGATSSYPICLNRGNADPSDDVQVLHGEAWISVTSPTEGTSFVTAVAPAFSNWQERRSTAMIYWVDAQWVFAPSAHVATGQPHVLTTTATRRTDGAPLAGWIVRYEAIGGGAALGYEGGNFVEVPTDADGRASVEVSPSSSGSGSTTVQMILVRPALAGPSASPELEIGTGSASITWGAGGTSGPSTFEPTPAYPSQPSAPYQPSEPSKPYTPYTPPANEQPTGQSDLSLELRAGGPTDLNVGDYIRFDVVVTNRGNGTATGIVVLDQFDRGLSHPQAQPGEAAVRYPGMRDLAPGETATVPLTFQAIVSGRHCHEVTVTAEDGARVVERQCINVRQPTPTTRPALEVSKLGPTRHLVGELAMFKIVIKNTGEVPVTNIEVVDQYDPTMNPQLADAGHERTADGRIVWRIDRLEVGERREFKVQCECLAPATSACNRALVTADGGVTYADEVCLEILPQFPGGGQSAAPAGNLRTSIVSSANPARVGERALINVTLQNTGQQAERNVVLWVNFPPELTPDQTQIQSTVPFQIAGADVQFSPIAEMQPGEQRVFVIPVSVNRAGSVSVWTQITATGAQQPIKTQSGAIQIVPGAF